VCARNTDADEDYRSRHTHYHCYRYCSCDQQQALARLAAQVRASHAQLIFNAVASARAAVGRAVREAFEDSPVRVYIDKIVKSLRWES